MFQKSPRFTCLILLGLIYILGLTDSYLTDEYDGEDVLDGIDLVEYEEDREDVAGSDFEQRVPTVKRNPAFIPYISLEALSNMKRFFENLKENFVTLEILPLDEREALLERREQMPEQDTRIFRPPATAAFLHAVRNQRPVHRMKTFIDKPEPISKDVSSRLSPSMPWSRLGRRR